MHQEQYFYTVFLFFRCNHDLLKAIEHFNKNNIHTLDSDSNTKNDNSTSAFKPVNSNTKLSKSYMIPHFGLYPFWPLLNTQFNPQPILSTPVLVQGFCECHQCKPEEWQTEMNGSVIYNKDSFGTS